MDNIVAKKDNSNRKKIIIIAITSLVIVLLITVGVIFKLNYVSDKDREKVLIVAGKEYYSKYMSGLIGLNEAEISLDMLKKNQEKSNQKYDLSKLDKCKGTTKILLTIKNGKISKEKVLLNCK